MRGALVFAAVVIAACASAAHAAPVVRSYQIGVDVRAGSSAQQYRTNALVVAFPAAYRAQITYVGGKRGYSGTYNDVPELMAANRSGLILNGGFYTTDPAIPAGLLLVNGRIISPMSFSQSATLCADQSGKLRILRTADLRPVAKSIASMCSDGLQTYPIVVRGGANDINLTELRRPRYVRSILGFRRDGSPVAVFFRAPVHLYVAAEFLRAPQSRSATVRVTSTSRGRAQASGGLGLVDAVNLSGDTDSFAALNGKVLVGDAYRELPSAILIR